MEWVEYVDVHNTRSLNYCQIFVRLRSYRQYVLKTKDILMLMTTIVILLVLLLLSFI